MWHEFLHFSNGLPLANPYFEAAGIIPQKNQIKYFYKIILFAVFYITDHLTPLSTMK